MGKISFSINYRFKKILEATLGQLIGRSINFLIPFVLLNLYVPSKTTDGFFLAFSIAFFSSAQLPIRLPMQAYHKL